MFGLFRNKKDNKPISDKGQKERDSRNYLINGEWVHVPNCVDDTPWAEADESPNNPRRSK
jgi:hypothetical protein